MSLLSHLINKIKIIEDDIISFYDVTVSNTLKGHSFYDIEEQN